MANLSYTCPHCNLPLWEAGKERLTKNLINVLLQCLGCKFEIDLTRREPA